MHDGFYSSRNRDYQSDACRRVYILCKTLHHNFGFLEGMDSGTVVSHLWDLLAKYDSTKRARSFDGFDQYSIRCQLYIGSYYLKY